MKNQVGETSNGTLHRHLLQNQVEETSNGTLHQHLLPRQRDMESLDYEIIMNETLKEDRRAGSRREMLEYGIAKWLFCCLVGIIAGLVALFLNITIENLAGRKLLLVTGFVRSGRYWAAFGIFTGINMALVLFSSAICAYVEPAAAGSGIPEIKAYLNGIDAHALGFRISLLKMIGSIAATSAGLYLEREGPLIHIGACIGYVLSKGGSRRFRLTWKWFRFFKNDRDRRDLVTCGVAAGVAAAFRAPVGGVLFALEEAATWWRSTLLWKTFFTTATVAMMLRFGRNMCKHGKCGLFGDGGLIMFDISNSYAFFRVADLLTIIILGTTGGLLGSLFNKLNSQVGIFYTRLYRQGRLMKVAPACLIALFTSICCFGLPFLAPCRPCPNLKDSPYMCPSYGKLGNFKIFNCPAGQYNDLAGLFFATKDDAVQNIFSTNTSKEYHYSSLLIFFMASYALTIVTYGIAVPSGLFIPIILIGATFGRTVGMTLTSTYYKAMHETGMDEGVYAVLGATALLGGSMRMTVALCIIILEVTNNLAMLPHIMLVLLISKGVGDLWTMAIYALYVRIKKFPMLSAYPTEYMHKLTAKDVVHKPLRQFNIVENVGIVYKHLVETSHNAFPVVSCSNNPIFAGLVLRQHLLILLNNRVFQEVERDPDIHIDFGKASSGRGLRINDICLTEEERKMKINLSPITNTSPYTVLENISLAKAYTLFRQLGLRHLCVLPLRTQDEPVVGLLTRRDFEDDYLEHVCNSLQRQQI